MYGLYFLFFFSKNETGLSRLRCISRGYPYGPGGDAGEISLPAVQLSAALAYPATAGPRTLYAALTIRGVRFVRQRGTNLRPRVTVYMMP